MDMRGIKASLPLVVFLAAAAGLAAEGPAASAPGAMETPGVAAPGAALPGVSRLRASVEGLSVVLTWVDSQGPATSYVVYRSRQAFGPEVLPKALRLASVGAGIGTYRDSPPPNQDWYYLVLALDADGLPALVFTPMATMTKFPLKIESQPAAASTTPRPAEAKAQPKAAAPAPEESAPAEAAENASPSASGPENQVAQVQGDEKIAESLSRASLDSVTAAGPSAFAASPEPAPVSTEERPAPLPYFLYNSGIPTSSVQGDRTHGEAEGISPASELAAAKLRGGNEGGRPAQPQLRDLAAAGGRIAAIVQGIDSVQDHGGMAAALRKYLETETSSEEKARARYYLGVCLVKDSILDSGIYELLKARDFFPVETRDWIDYATALLGEGGK
jgi:hypothetical protein